MDRTTRVEMPTQIIALVLLSSALVLGGGQGTLGDAFTQILALVLLMALIFENPNIKQWPKTSWLAIIPFIPLLLFLLPMPDFITHAGTARSNLNQMLGPVTGGIGPQASLSSIYTERAIFWLLPFAALFLSALQMSVKQKKILSAVLVFWIFVGAIIGLAQKAGGLESAWYFYSNTNYGSAVGFFANSNHYAIAMAASLPLIWAGLTMLFNLRNSRHVSPFWFVLFAGVAILFILGFMLSGSRAGLVLGMFGCLLMLPAVILADKHKGAKHWLFGILVVGLFFSIQIGLLFISLQFEASPMEDLRWQLFPVVSHAAEQFSPLGSGPGSFWFIFPQYDELFLTGNVIANHAHNDYLELWLETRWVFASVALLSILAFIWQGITIWFRADNFTTNSILLARAAWVGLLLLLLHSIVDYPLRTTSVLTMAGLLLAFIVSLDNRPIVAEQE